MIKTLKTILPVVSVFVAFVAAPLVISSVVSAATPTGLIVTPIHNNLTIAAGERQTVKVDVTNNYPQTYAIQNSVYDIALQPDGTSQVLLNGQNAPNNSLRNYIRPIPSFTLPPSTSKDVLISIAIPPSLATGTYYASVVFRPVSTGSRPDLLGGVGSIIEAKVTKPPIASPPAPVKSSSARLIWGCVIVVLVLIEAYLVRLYVKNRKPNTN